MSTLPAAAPGAQMHVQVARFNQPGCALGQGQVLRAARQA